MMNILLGLAAALPVLAACIYATFAFAGWAIKRMNLPGWMAFAFCVLTPMFIGTALLGFLIFGAVSGYGFPWS